MYRYIALLRGINVGGYRKIKMDDLRAMFTDMQCENVATYIQSGNVVFDAPEENPKMLARQISDQIDQFFGHEVPVIILTKDELERACHELPFEQKSGWKIYFSFLPKQPAQKPFEKLQEYASEIEHFHTAERVIYSFIDKTSNQTPNFSNAFIEKLVNMPSTTRNLRTVNKLMDMANS